MKRFLSMLATLVLVGQSVVTPLVYATDFVNENQETVPVASVETEVADSVSDESDDNEVATDVDNPLDDAEDSAELEESADAEDSAELEESADAEESVKTEDAETSEVVKTEKAEETVTEETSAEDVEESSIEESVSYGKSFSSTLSQSWREISTNGLMVTAIDSLGAFPKGTEMVVTAIEEDEVFDLVNDAIEANVTKVRAVDITFWYDGEEVEPTQPINVTIRALNMTEPQTVVHIDDEENVEEIDADINGKTAEFEAESFSIYAIVETAVLTVNFHNGEDTVATVFVKSADEVESLVYDPGVGTEEAGDVFRGWTTDVNYDTGTASMTIKDVHEDIASNLGETKTLDYYAMVFKHYTITYQDEDGVVIASDEVLFKGTETQSYEYTITQNYNPKKQDQNFEGWKKVDGGDDLYQYEGKIAVDSDIILKAAVQEGHWLIFNENGKGATYIAPQFIETNAKTVEPTTDMVRQGYTFGGWYKEAECINAFTFGTTIDTGTTIYAKWTPIASANYTVLIWKQNVAGDGYDFEESVSLNGAVGETVDKVTQQGNGNNAYARVNGSDKKYVGFHLKEFDQNVEIKAEGNSVVNVYYDRTEYKLTFQVYDYAYTVSVNDNDNNPEKYGDVNGQKVRVYWKNGAFRTSNNNYGTVYNGTVYTRSNNQSWQDIKYITALYGQNIRSNFPIEGTNGVKYAGASWSPNGSSIFDNGAYVSYIDTMQEEDTTFRLAYNPVSNYYTYHVKYYVEALPGDTNTVTYDSKKFTLYHDAEIHFQDSDLYSTESEEFTDITGFEKYKSNPAYSNGKADFDKNRTISLYYTRQKYPINFMDGRYVDGNNNKLEDHSKEQLTTTDNILYGADITSYNKDGADYYTPTAPAGYVFEGWYLDDACTQEADFTTMPEGGLTVYAKWRQIQYRVFLHPNVPTDDDTLDWGSTGQAMNFRISYGGKVSAPEGRRDEYDFVGWYSDEGLTKAFNADAFVLNEKTVTSDYDKTSDFTDPMDKYGNGATTNSDITGNDGEDRFWITKKLDLYAKWRSKLLGASGMNIVYDAVEGTGEPTDGGLYVDGSQAVAGAASTPSDSNYQFKYWVVQKWNGTKYVDTDVVVYPGESFEVLKTNAYVVKNENSTEDEPSYTYTIKLRAEYVEKGENEKTTIQYCPNYEGAGECEEVELVVNKEHVILDNMFNRGEGYVFNGWKDSEDNEWNVGSGVGADNKDPIPNVLNAQWKCDTNYHTEDGGKTCVSDKKEVDCATGEIENGEYVVEKVEIEWNGKAWEETPACTKIECADDYHLNETNNTCEADELEGESCGEFNVENAEIVNRTFTSIWSGNAYTTAPEWSMDGEECTYKCKEGFHSEDGKTCVSDKKEVDCATGEIENGEYVVEKVEIEWNGKAWEETPACTKIECADDYHLNETNNTCEADELEGESCGEFNVENAEIVNRTFTSIWSGNAYTTAPEWSMDGEECTYKCKEGFHSEDGKTCVSDKKEVDCATGEIENGEYVVEKVEIEWNGKAWEEAPACTKIECADDYHLNETNNTCEADELEGESCGEFNVENAEIVNRTFTSIWSGNAYTTAPEWSMDGEECTYKCKEGFHSEDGKTCVSDKKEVDCATGEIENGEYVVEKVEIEWNGKAWEETPACTKIECADDYHLNETNNTCEADELEGESCGEFNVENAEIVNRTFTSIWSGNAYTTAPEWSMDGEECTYKCKEGFHSEDGKTCVSDKKEVDCATGEIENGEYVVEKVEIEWNGKAWEEAPACTKIECADDYHLNETNNTCEADELEGESCGEFNVENAEIVNRTFTSIWSGNAYTTAPEWSMDGEECTYKCKEGFHSEDGKTCVSDKKEVETLDVCGELAKDSNAHYLTGTQTLTYTVDENGEGSWSDPICTAVCEDNYHEVKAESTAGNDNEPVDVTIADGVKTNNADGTVDETTENTESETSKVNNFRCEIDTFTVTFNSNGGSAVSGQSVEYGKTATKPADPTKSSNTFKGWFDNSELSGEIFNFVDTPITGDITLYAKWDKVSNGGGGGGGGGSSSSSYRCENLPENAVANNTDKPNRNTDYSYSDDTSKVCTFQCKSGYTRDKDNKKCVKSENPGGGNGGEEEIELGGQVSDKCSVEGFNGSEEEKAAYLYACENDITTIRDINEARLKDFLTRAEMAKMVSVFATKELGMKPNISKDCSNFANSISHYNQEMKDYMVMSCQLELMGIHTVNYEPIPDFMPSKRVSRAEFGTVLSRVLWGNKYEGTNSNYYINHLNALKENNIITNINPNITEYRAWVFLMLYRAVEAIKVLKSTNNVAIDQQVNEELQEEGKAETGLVVEYDSGSVVPDMATLTESGTLATGAVAKVESGNVAESQTGATILTGEDASKEVSAETGVVAETGSTSD